MDGVRHSGPNTLEDSILFQTKTRGEEGEGYAMRI